MSSYSNFEKISDKCISYIKNETPKNAIEKIRSIEQPQCGVIGYKTAFNIYKRGADYSVEYNENKYRNNIPEFKNKVNRNIKIAKHASLNGC